jgi:hypothetical protein
MARGRRVSRAAVLPKSRSSLCLMPNFSFVNCGERSRTRHISPKGRLTWTGAWKTAFASAPMRCGPHMAACTAKPSSIGLRPNGKCWRHRRPPSPADRPRKRSAHRLHIRRPPERSRGPADATPTTRSTLSSERAISYQPGSLFCICGVCFKRMCFKAYKSVQKTRLR